MKQPEYIEGRQAKNGGHCPQFSSSQFSSRPQESGVHHAVSREGADRHR